MNFDPPPAAPRPTAIRNDKDGKRILITWADGLQSEAPWSRLRWRCPCAVCQGEFGSPGRLSMVTELSEDELTLESLRGVGNYGVGATWKDGHDTGIYPWPLLRAIVEED